MKNFTSLPLKPEYRSPQDDVVKDVFIPALKCAKIYKRAVGFFSSTSLSEITKGIDSLVENDGKIQIVASPHLSESDEQAIKLGYEKRIEVIEKKLLGELDKIINDYFKAKRLNILANLIANNILDLKIAFTDIGNDAGMYHEKLGIFEDDEGNKICFDGSMNESITAMRYNYESVNIYCSWKTEDKERCVAKVRAFENIWNNTDKKLTVVDFPSVTQKILDKYKRKDFSKSDLIQKIKGIDEHELNPKEMEYIFSEEKELEVHDSGNSEMTSDVLITPLEASSEKSFFVFTDGKSPRQYQQDAINKFKENNYQCLFAMATGTGKTLTSLFAANELYKEHNFTGLLILVPLKDLVEQWNKDVSKYFNETIIQIHSGTDWKEKVDSYSLQKLLNPDKTGKLIVISTYDSFSINKNKILKLFDLDKALFIADECHKTGANTYRRNLPKEIPYRIGLSATPKRPFDLKGTKAVFDYFDPNENPYEFTIKEAIDKDMLCHYNYYPIIVNLTPDEMDLYGEYTEKINKLLVLINSDNATEDEEERLEQLLKERHRIIERADNKFDIFIDVFMNELKKYTKNTIVFAPDGIDENKNDILTKYKNAIIENSKMRNMYLTVVEYVQGVDKSILEQFAKEKIDIVLAKQRLNEGIDIPSARRAFFIASSTSEREFIQRRGRVLRPCEGKIIAEIFDFIVVPPENAENIYGFKICKQIKENELNRAIDFAENADNFFEITEKLNKYM